MSDPRTAPLPLQPPDELRRVLASIWTAQRLADRFVKSHPRLAGRDGGGQLASPHEIRADLDAWSRLSDMAGRQIEGWAELPAVIGFQFTAAEAGGLVLAALADLTAAVGQDGGLSLTCPACNGRPIEVRAPPPAGPAGPAAVGAPAPRRDEPAPAIRRLRLLAAAMDTAAALADDCLDDLPWGEEPGHAAHLEHAVRAVSYVATQVGASVGSNIPAAGLLPETDSFGEDFRRMAAEADRLDDIDEATDPPEPAATALGHHQHSALADVEAIGAALRAVGGMCAMFLRDHPAGCPCVGCHRLDYPVVVRDTVTGVRAFARMAVDSLDGANALLPGGDGQTPTANLRAAAAHYAEACDLFEREGPTIATARAGVGAPAPRSEGGGR